MPTESVGVGTPRPTHPYYSLSIIYSVIILYGRINCSLSL